jgi:hypothetical protein
VLEHGAQLLAIVLAARVEGAAQTRERAPQP